ncbi:MAG: hypothetical protein ABI566_03335 [Pseudolysinimonas sp.]
MEGRDLDAPEMHRGRARSVAGLAATGAAAVGAGLVFIGGAQPIWVRVPATASFVLLLTALVLFSWASTYRRAGTVNETHAQTSQRFVNAIKRISLAGSIVSIVAVAALAAAVATNAFWSVEARPVFVTTLEPIDLPPCPGLANPFEATLLSRIETGEPLHLTVSAEECGAAVGIDIYVPQGTVRSVVVR